MRSPAEALGAQADALHLQLMLLHPELQDQIALGEEHTLSACSAQACRSGYDVGISLDCVLLAHLRQVSKTFGNMYGEPQPSKMVHQPNFASIRS